MKPLDPPPSLTDRVYDAIVDEICEGRLPAGTHLVQEQLAQRLGVSRQPIQQALALLKADGLIEEVGRRGMQVAALDLRAMRHHYDVRAALDALAAREAAKRVRGNLRAASDLDKRGRKILDAGRQAIVKDGVAQQIREDEAFHALLYEASGNPLLRRTVEPHWRFLRRIMGEVLRHGEPPRTIWRQHEEILDAVLAGDAERSERLALNHVQVAAETLEQTIKSGGLDLNLAPTG
ncbi:MAG: GntR family transcriptional regulator [Alphaproteobacteria bacterium]